MEIEYNNHQPLQKQQFDVSCHIVYRMRIHELFLLTTHWNQWCSNCVSSSTQRSVRFVVAVESNTNDSGSIPKSHTLLIFISEETEATPWPSLYAGVRVNRHGIYPTTIMAEATRQRHLHNSADFTPPKLSPSLWNDGGKDGGWMSRIGHWEKF